MSGYTLQMGGNPLTAWVTDSDGRETLRIEADFQDGATRQDAIRQIAEATGKDPSKVATALAMLAERVVPLSFWEMEAALGSNIPVSGVYHYKEAEPKPGVASRVKDPPEDYYSSDDKSALWRYAAELFPRPKGLKPWGKSAILTNDNGDKVVGAFLTSPSWRNPANAADKLQAAFVNLIIRLAGADLHRIDVAADDWSAKKRKSLAARIRRAGAKAVRFDNLLARGYVRYLLDAPLKGTTPVEDLESTLVDALRAIRPPERGDDDRRFKPIEGSSEWVDGVYANSDPDREKLHIIATSSGPDKKDLVDLEIIAVAEGLRYEWVRSYWRRQWGPGILVYGITAREMLEILVANGYVPTRYGLALLKAEVAV